MFNDKYSMINDEKYFSANTKLTQKSQTLIIGRLLIIFLLLVVSWIWNNGRLKLSFEDFARANEEEFVVTIKLVAT